MTAAAALASLPAFRACATQDIERFVKLAPPVRFHGQSVLIRQGEPAQGAFLVLSGRCRAEVQRGDERVVVGHVQAGEVVGELGLFTSAARRSATVIAEEDVQALLLTQDLFDRPHALPVLSVIERRALATMAERVRRSSQATRRRRPRPAAPAAHTGKDWLAGLMGALQRLTGG
ncbi:cyclic nucleotide-binding domain-containing protein [Myxococcota bacterium]|nr:cyclic nucleotide-binding domain-containing protein [Myxococcota bacterium]